ncbi:MAG: peptide ABC transporter substrate-binding protein [Anaerolineae bacterium]|nr:peptide ABC transporter substrate-binding protein [Anaerolineae bacterium]
MKHRLFLVLTLVLMLALVVAPTFAQDKKVVTISYTQEPSTLNPLYITQWFASNVDDMVLTPPWFIDDQQVAVPVQVTEIPSTENGGISADGTVMTMKLRDDLKWSDGEPITSKDYLFTYEMLMSDKNTVASRSPWDTKVKTVTAPDDKTVVVTFNEPFAPWLTSLFTSAPAMPEHTLRPVFDKDGTLDNADWNRTINPGSGAFKVEQWESGSFLSLVPSDNFWGGKPKVDQVFFRIVADDGTSQNAALEAGDADIGPFLSAADAVELEKKGLVISQVSSGYNEGWYFNVNPKTTNPAMLDVNVRKALVMAFDRQKIVTDLLFDKTRVATSYWDGSIYTRPDPKAYPYDPEAAAKMLDDAGWKDTNGDGTRDKDGTELVLRFVASQRQIRKDVQAVVQQAFAKIGVKVVTSNYDNFFDSYGAGGPMATGAYEIGEYSSAPLFPDPHTLDFLCSEIPSDEKPEGSNWTGYCDKDLDALFQEELKTTDHDARVKLFQQIDQKLNDAVIWTGVWYDADLWATTKRVENTKYSGADPFWNAINWDVTK